MAASGHRSPWKRVERMIYIPGLEGNRYLNVDFLKESILLL